VTPLAHSRSIGSSLHDRTQRGIPSDWMTYQPCPGLSVTQLQGLRRRHSHLGRFRWLLRRGVDQRDSAYAEEHLRQLDLV